MLKTGSKIRIRRAWEKLMMTIGIIEARNGSVGFSQSYDGDSYSPDHGLNALVLTPDMSAIAPDLKVQMPWIVGDMNNPGVPNVAWKVNGQNINTVWVENTDYEFNDDGSELWIYKNLDTSEVCEVTCEVLVRDTRTSINVPIKSEAAKLTCISSTEAATTLSLSTNRIDYDDMADEYTEWLYRNSRGLPQLKSEADAKANSFIKQVDIVVAKGSKGQQTDGFGLRVTDSSGAVVAQLNASQSTATIHDPDRILSLTRTMLEIDCRTIQGEQFTIQAYKADNTTPIVTAFDTLEVSRSHRDIETPTVTNKADYQSHHTRYHNKVKVSSNGGEIEHPEAYLYVEFKTQSYESGSSERLVGAGNECWFNPVEAGGGITPQDNGFDMWPEVDYHAVSEVAKDESNNYLTDENGDRLLI